MTKEAFKAWIRQQDSGKRVRVQSALDLGGPGSPLQLALQSPARSTSRQALLSASRQLPLGLAAPRQLPLGLAAPRQLPLVPLDLAAPRQLPMVPLDLAAPRQLPLDLAAPGPGSLQAAAPPWGQAAALQQPQGQATAWHQAQWAASSQQPTQPAPQPAEKPKSVVNAFMFFKKSVSGQFRGKGLSPAQQNAAIGVLWRELRQEGGDEPFQQMYMADKARFERERDAHKIR